MCQYILHYVCALAYYNVYASIYIYIYISLMMRSACVCMYVCVSVCACLYTGDPDAVRSRCVISHINKPLSLMWQLLTGARCKEPNPDHYITSAKQHTLSTGLSTTQLCVCTYVCMCMYVYMCVCVCGRQTLPEQTCPDRELQVPGCPSNTGAMVDLQVR